MSKEKTQGRVLDYWDLKVLSSTIRRDLYAEIASYRQDGWDTRGNFEGVALGEHIYWYITVIKPVWKE